MRSAVRLNDSVHLAAADHQAAALRDVVLNQAFREIIIPDDGNRNIVQLYDSISSSVLS